MADFYFAYSATISCSAQTGSSAAGSSAWAGAISFMPYTGSSKSSGAFSPNWSRMVFIR